MDIRYPEITVPMSDEDGNVFAIMGRVTKALRRADVDDDTIAEFTAEASSGDYDHALQTVMAWVETS
ncbi:hypothetical protein LCGC14_1996010 [marine sediment metagenome]|uniref:Uncharacterized protein n=1 Tax=marine sediment metagenome TaxID=412755 RepID=A0A0F9HI43_9ZZZZ